MREHRLAAEATLAGAMGLNSQDIEERPLELLGGAEVPLLGRAGGARGRWPGPHPGLRHAGLPAVRGPHLDRAREPSAAPRPPLGASARGTPPVSAHGPEDKDGFQDEDGCPDPDNDGDGLAGRADKCPNQPETKNGFEDADGCPDELPPPRRWTRTGTGSRTTRTSAPARPRTRTASRTRTAARTRTTTRTACRTRRTSARRAGGHQRGEGRGRLPGRGQVEGARRGASDRHPRQGLLRHEQGCILARSFDLLKQVAAVLRANPQITRVRVEGHTDSQGNRTPATWTSRSAARNNVRKRLIEQEGVARRAAGGGGLRRGAAGGHQQDGRGAREQPPRGVHHPRDGERGALTLFKGGSPVRG